MTDVTHNSRSAPSPSPDRVAPDNSQNALQARRALGHAGYPEPADENDWPECVAMHAWSSRSLAVVVVKYREGPGFEITGYRFEPLCASCADALPGWMQARIVARLDPLEWHGVVNCPAGPQQGTLL